MATKITLRPEGATDSSTDVVLADGSDRTDDNARGPSAGSITVYVKDQPFSPIRATNTTFQNRENRSGSYTFQTSRKFSSAANAARFMITHGMTLPASGTLIFDYGDTAAGGLLGVLFGCVLRQIGDLRQNGQTILGNYTAVFSDADTVTAASLGYEITSRMASPASPTARRINCGGWEENGWDGDSGWDGSTAPGYTAAAITGAGDVPAEIYRTSRRGSEFSYTVPLVDGTYDVHLHFAEPEADAAGERVFAVSINGVPFRAAVDLFDEAGGQNTALVLSAESVAVETALAISFLADTGLALVCGIEVTPHVEEE